MPSPLPEKDATEMINLLAHNQEVFQILLAFVEMSRGFKVAFAEVNFPPDIDILLTELREHSKCESIQFEVLHFDDPDLHFLLEEIKQKLAKIIPQPNKKLILILRGLEKSIAYSGDNPPILTNLNYARDSFPVVIPHPVLFVLPDYAVTRLARFAPDFWAWTTATFRFQTPPETTERLTTEVTNHTHNPNRYFAKPEQGERIDLLERLLQEYPEDTEASSRTRLELLTQLGQAHQSIREFAQAKSYFQQAIDLSREIGYKHGEASALFNLGDIYYDMREFAQAKLSLQQSLSIQEEIGDKQNQASTYHLLGMVAEALQEYAEARQNYQQALAIEVEYGDLYSQAAIYGQLGSVALALREYAEARQNYQQALAIEVEYGDLYSQSAIYGQLGSVALALREYTVAQENYQQSLQINIEYGDLYSQALTYHQLGIVALALREYAEAREYYQQALQIYVEYGDRYSQARSYEGLGRVAEELENFPEAKNNFLRALGIRHECKDEYGIQTYALPNLSRLYQATQDESLLTAMAQTLGVTVAEIRQALELT